jgi:predicted dehydrogenase
MTKFIKSLFLVCFITLVFVSCNEQAKAPASYLIKTETPARPAGQTHVVGLAVDPIETIRVGFIGLGMRGPYAVQRFAHLEGVEVVALCDLHLDRVQKVQKTLTDNGNPAAAEYYGADGWKELMKRNDIDLVYIATNWDDRGDMIVTAVESGKHVAVEHPGVTSMEDIWRVINAAEKHRKHVMLLANVVYGNFELTTLNMVQQGVFGETLYAEGAYIHQLEAFWNAYEGDWRMKENRAKRGDLYPIHGIGSAALALNINRGDRLTHLVSMDTRPVSIPVWLRENRGENVTWEDVANGQNTMTLIQTEKGKAINLQRDIASPRPYSRMYAVAGTKGYLSGFPVQGIALEGDFVAQTLGEDGRPDLNDLDAHSWLPDDARRALLAKYRHPILNDELLDVSRSLGRIAHGGMDFIMDYRLIYCLRNGLPLDMSVYDLATWNSIVPLTAKSLENGSAPVEIPDFTRGYWNLVQGVHFALTKE